MNQQVARQTSPPQLAPPTQHFTFTVQLSPTRRGARLARRLAVQRLADWGIPYGGETSDAVALLVAELAANAVRHGAVPGRDFRLALALHPAEEPPAALLLRIEVSDARPEKRPRLSPPAEAETDVATSGRGLLLVDHLATRWGATDRHQVGKTVWAELDLPAAPGTGPA
ncbi:ATP-binding protein [Streptomyces sp. NPDC021093]|uniref:ATP-binding protein n=1 Tax=Streptomyces sp. NPDC021093 TaxID=3365112 RepID=UPI00378E9CEF